jgi:filamentous hemagglutinin family protein
MKKHLILNGRERTFLVLVPLWLVLAGGRGYANPQGMTVVSGSAQSAQQGNSLQITTSQNAVLQWNSFNIAAGQTTVFQQPSATSIVFNNINNASPSTIFGSLHANGIVVLQNSSGFYFGPNAFVQAGGLVVTTAAINPWSSGGGAGWSFDGPPAASPIVNYGCLETASGGSLFLIAKQIGNQGTIAAPGGTAALVAGQEVLLSARPDGLSLSAPVQLPAGSVDNRGKIVADAGQVLLQAQTVNNSGVIQADSVRQNNGVIELYASQDIQLAGSSVIQANGGGAGISAGGNIVIKSGGAFSDNAGSRITATGGANGGNGGSIEISAPNMLSLNSSMDASAQPGFTGGQLFLDPTTINIGTTANGGLSATANGTVGTVAYGSAPSILNLDVGSSFTGFSQITLQATGNINITLNANTPWNLSASTGETTGQLTLQAGGNITLSSGSMIQDANNWSVTLDAGYNFTGANAGQVTSGTGAVTLSGNAAIQTAAGSISVLAGNSVTVGSGGIVTGIVSQIVNGAAINTLLAGTGGNVSVTADSGNVNCGTSTAGYTFTQTGVGYGVNPNLGGISTASGGNVFIQAGGNITAEMPASGAAVAADAGSGAFGAAPGNVTLMAGGNVTGHYVLANGSGSITAGMSAGTGNGNTGFALSLIKGGWVVNAANNILLQEVRNPNGMFNSQTYVTGTSVRNPLQYLFNYDPLAYVVLDAGQGVTITGGGPRPAGSREGLIFPPSLTIEAGAGGITLKQNLSLFPSPEGGLVMTTTAGGNLTESANTSIVVSDSQSVQWTGSSTFTHNDLNPNDLLHLDDPNPVLINISGSVSDFNLYSPKSVQMYAAGNIVDSSATILNLRPTDTTIISAGGEILDHSSYVIVTLPFGEKPDFTALDQIAEPTIPGPGNIQIPNPNLNYTLYNQENEFVYDPTTGSLRYQGVMSSQVEQALLAMTTPFLDAATIKTIYAQSQSDTSGTAPGYTVAGPGTFRINAGSIDLGNGDGLISLGISGHPALAPYTARGADIDISTGGNLSMVASTITSDYGGAINITCGGTIDVGSLLVPPASDQTLVGIVSLWSGNISVIAAGDINVDGSRIAAYDGGNIFVESLDGNVNAGTGGGKGVPVHKSYVNKNGQLEVITDVIPGSGILATSFPELVYGEKSGHVGNITVETPEGNIEASKGGIVQLALGPGAANDATIDLDAGTKNSGGMAEYVGNVDASGSGVIGGHVNITATGNINGLIVASLGASVVALQNISATVLSQGGATVSAGGTVSGTIVGLGSVSVSGASDVAAAFSAGAVSASGAQSGAAVAAAPTGSSSASAAATTQQVNQSTQSNSDVAANGAEDDNDLLKKKKKAQLMEYQGRVTVLLPE